MPGYDMMPLAYVVAESGGGSQPNKGTPASWIWMSYRPEYTFIEYRENLSDWFSLNMYSIFGRLK